ncbi:MAG: TonB family protein [Spongiibacteraceae bacterium]
MPTTNSAEIVDGKLSHDRLGFAFCLALALHAMPILGISFNQQEKSPAPLKLEITLAQHQSQQAPEEADFLAQHNQQGSGTLTEKAMLTTRELADFQDIHIQQVTPQQQASNSQPQPSKNPILSSLDAKRTIHHSPQTKAQPAEQHERANSDLTILQRSLEIASLEAKLDTQEQAYAKRPRIRRLTSVATKQADDALYLHNWRSKVESIGNQHYPSNAKQQQLYGDLRMMVSILPNGDIHQVKILQSSGHKILDQAAIRIVHLAAPYDPFPQTMQREVDVLEIIRTWRFHKDRLSSNI